MILFTSPLRLSNCPIGEGSNRKLFPPPLTLFREFSTRYTQPLFQVLFGEHHLPALKRAANEASHELLARINHQFENWAPYCLEISLQYCLWPVQSMIRHFSAQLKHKVSNLVVVEEILALVRHDRADFDALTTPGASTKTGHWMC